VLSNNSLEQPANKGDQAVAEILEAAKRLFLTQGYNGTSVRAIAKEAGNRAVAGLYNHFPTKRSIFEALIQQLNPYREVLPKLEAIQADTAPDFIRQGLKVVMRVMLDNYDFIQLVQIDMREFQGVTFRQLLQTDVLPRALVIYNRVTSLPGLKPLDNPMALLRILASTVLGYVISQKVAPSGFLDHMPTDEWNVRFIEFILHGIAE
jgi:AcrR family transcriptional regulator